MILPKETPQQLEIIITNKYPTAFDAYKKSAHISAQLLPYQALAIYALTRRFNVEGAHILEIGTAAGYSASLMAQAAPEAKITTLNPRDWEVITARLNLAPWPNVIAIEAKSWDYLETYNAPELDMVFVDGDHNRIFRDMPWFNLLKVGGLMLFHDYSEVSCPSVFKTVRNFMLELKRSLDVEIIDSDFIGMAGIVRRDGETWSR